MSADFLHPERPVHKAGDKLPHWQQGEVIQFVTFRLGDAIPQNKVEHYTAQRRIWLLNNPEPWSPETEAAYHRLFSWRLERWLDQGHGSCLLREEFPRNILADILMRFDGERVRHHAWIIMPNHVHLLFTPLAPLGKLIQSWKSTSATRIAGRPIWQRNYRDTMIRDSSHFANAVRYIRRNPAKARLQPHEFTLWQSARALGIP